MTTIKEIAEMAGVSMTTVYNVLHGNVKKVSKANMEKIQALLDEYHYVPKMGLRALKNNSSKIIGVVIHTSRYYENTVISDTFYSHVIGALEESLRKEGYYMMLYAAEDLEEIFHMSLAWNVDGLIAITFKYHNYIKLKTLINKPIVAIDLIDKEAEDYVNVGLQDENGGYIMTKYLLEKGYEKIYVCARKNAGVDHERWMRGTPVRPLAGDVRRDLELLQHPGAASRPHGGDFAFRLHRRRKGAHRRTPSDPQAYGIQRRHGEGSAHHRGRRSRHHPLLHA